MKEERLKEVPEKRVDIVQVKVKLIREKTMLYNIHVLNQLFSLSKVIY
ncbi:hypothetical protein [Lysinibacillus sp. FSL K6-4013]